MPEFAAPDYGLARLVLERGIGAVYLVAFLVAARQFPALLGERGLQPAPAFLRAVPFRRAPSLFHLGYSDRALRAVAWTGVGLAAAMVLGIPQLAPLPVTMLTWFVLWVLYLSIVNIGQTFYGFGWESLLLEAGFLAIFLGNGSVAPPWLVLVLFRWLAFRVEFGAGLIKLRGDPCWRALRCMEWHHETQPMPNPLSWFFHRLPKPIHRMEVVGNFVAQLLLPIALFLPQPIASVAAALMIASQLYLVVSGNYAWLNWLTIVVAAAAIGDTVLPPGVLSAFGLPLAQTASFGPAPGWYTVAVAVLAIVVGALSYYPIRNLLSSRQAMNASFDPFHLVNTYGAFGTVGRQRYEIVIEGTQGAVQDEDGWRAYEFKGKPGDPRRLPRQFAPYHLRLDWMLWFLPLSPAYGEGWFATFLARLLEGDRQTLRLLRNDPFPDAPPRWIRVRLVHYRYTTWQERRASGAWWVPTPAGMYQGPARLP